MKKIGILMVATLVLTGCVQQVELTDQESEIIANYAAYVTLQHDKNYNKILVETSSELTEQADAAMTEEGQMDAPITDSTNTLPEEMAEGEEAEAENKDIASTLNLEGFQITYEGFEYAKQYSDPAQEDGYIANSLDNSEFIIMKFKVENLTDEAKNCDVLSLSPRLKVSINGEEPVKTYGSLLNNDLSTLFNEIGAHETMDVVILVEVSEEYDNNVSTLSVDMVVNGETSTFELNELTF
jgi:hypothetical protein